MSRKRIYQPTETHLALHPPSSIAVCKCEVKFIVRPIADGDPDDDPELCLTCNRKGWSRLWNGNRPIQREPGEVVVMTDRRSRR